MPSRILSWAVLLFLASLAAGCEEKLLAADCGRGAGYDFCAYTPPEGVAGDPATHLYFLHGAGEDAASWGRWEVARGYYEDFRRRGLAAPTVVAVSFGKVWLLTEPGKARLSGLLPRFVAEAIPEVEKKLGTPKRRLLWGLSMGGFNGSQLLLKYPALWSAGVLSCPALSTLPPLAGEKEIDDYVRRTGAERAKAEWMARTAQDFFAAPEEWARHAPIVLAERPGPLPPLLVECGDKDEYGFFEGARAFTEALARGGHRSQFIPLVGGVHCTVGPERVFSFLAASLYGDKAG